MKKERIRLSLDLSPELYSQIKELADKMDLTVAGAIRVALQEYLKQQKEMNL